MKHHLLAGAAVVISGIGAQQAQAQSYEDWTGFSAGIIGGALMNDDDSDERVLFDRNLDGNFNDTVTTPGGADAFSPGFCGGLPRGPAATTGCQSERDGAEAAFRVGYDHQFGPIVVGALGEIAGSSAADSVTAFSVTPANYVFKRSLQGVAAVRARVGYAIGPALVYGTGGYAVGRLDNRFSSSNTVNSFSTTSDDTEDADGWQAGGGVEYRLARNLSVVGEYIYTSLDVDEDFVVRVGRGGAPATNPFILPPNSTGTDMIRSSDTFRTHAARIGLVFRF